MKLTDDTVEGKPRLNVDDIRREVSLTRSKYLIVEGNADRRFFTEWVRTIGVRWMPSYSEPHIICIGDIDVPDGVLIREGVALGNRGRILCLSNELNDFANKLRCVVDVDCGEHRDEFSSPVLMWTDFPALESYAFNPHVLDTLNRNMLSERLPEGDMLISLLREALRDLYVVRHQNPSLARPLVSKGVIKRDGDYAGFDVRKTVPPNVAVKVGEYDSPAYSDVREVVYGHDLAALLMAVFGNLIKNQCGLRDEEALENGLRMAILVEGSFARMPLFSGLADWMGG